MYPSQLIEGDRQLMANVYLGLGSNIGDKKQYIIDAIEALSDDRHINLIQVAEMIETEPYGHVEQDDFLNTCVHIETDYTPYEMLDKAMEIEQSLDRERLIKWGPRTIDIDILLYKDLQIEQDNLTIPHEELHLRSFVLEPLNSIAKDVVHPVFNQTIHELYLDLKRKEMKE